MIVIDLFVLHGQL